MKLHPWIVSAFVAFGVASCGENGPPPAGSSAPPRNLVSASVPHSPSRSPVINDAPVPPKNAQWTILCDTVEGPGHVENARDLKAIAIKQSGMTDWYLIHGDKESTLYYGYYGSLDDPAERARAEKDRARISELKDRLKNRLLRGGAMVAIIAPDPAAPPEWNLLNAPKDAYWTIEIATFADNPKRKEAAVEMVRQLRQVGEKAFYYHGPTASSVCIGAWPREAVAEQGTGIDRNGKLRDDAHAASAEEPIFVFGGYDTLPPNVANDVREPGTGKRMLVEGNRLEIIDPTLKKKTVQFPTHSVNYEVHGTQNGNQVFPDPSVLVIIPRTEQAAPPGEDNYLLTGGTPAAAGAQPGPPQPSTPGDANLRSIGDR